MWQLPVKSGLLTPRLSHTRVTSKMSSSNVLHWTWGVELFQKRKTDEGLTLLECVVAIAIVALTGALITPPLFLATATRVQNRRSEQALQLAQGEIDRIRTLVEQGEHDIADLPAEITGGFPEAAPTTVANFIRTVNTETCPGNPPLYDDNDPPIPASALLPIDTDGDCEEDFYLQSFRTAGGRTSENRPSDFEVGVRVYARNVVDTNGRVGTLTTEQAALGFTSGEGNQRESPLAVLYTRATWDGSGVAVYCYHNADGCAASP